MPPRRLGLVEDVADVANGFVKEVAVGFDTPHKIAKHGLVGGIKTSFNDLVAARDDTIRSSNKMLKNLGFKGEDKLQSVEIKETVDALYNLFNKPKEKLKEYSLPMPIKKKNSKAPMVGFGRSVVAPAATSKIMKAKPVKVGGKPNCITISHREYFSDVVASGTGFALAYGSGYVIDPAEPGTFPWLAPIACQFQKFRLSSFKVEYVSDSASSTNGSILISFNRNAASTIPANKQMMLEASECIRCPVWQNAVMSVKCDKTDYWVQPYAYPPSSTVPNYGPGTVSVANNSQTTQAGILFIATSGVTATTALGEVYIDFTFELSEPISVLPPVILGGLQVNAGSSATNPWPNPQLIGNGINIFGTLDIQIGGTAGYNFLYPGDYMLTITYTSTASDTLGLTVSGTQTATLIAQTSSSTSVTACWLVTGGVIGNNEYATITGIAHLATLVSAPFKMYFTNYSGLVANLPKL